MQRLTPSSGLSATFSFRPQRVLREKDSLLQQLYTWVFGVAFSPLSLRERARVRGSIRAITTKLQEYSPHLIRQHPRKEIRSQINRFCRIPTANSSIQ